MNRRAIENVILLAISLLILTLGFSPFLFSKGMMGIYDWGHAVTAQEVIRRTILDFHQWPANNPWIMGGQPVLENPLTLRSILVFLFGTMEGVRVAVWAYAVMGFIGAWLLSGLWWRNRLVRIVFCFYVVANPAVSYHLVVGHHTFMNYFYFPWIFYFLLRFDQDPWSGLKAAVFAGLALLDSFMYTAQYGMLILGCLWAWFFMTRDARARSQLKHWLLLFFPVFLTITIHQLLMILAVGRDFPREANYLIHYNIFTFLNSFFVPHYGLFQLPSQPQPYCTVTWEVCCYLGLAATFFAVWGARIKMRWWHGAVLLLIWALMGNDNPLFLMYWIKKLPTFSSHLCFARIRMFLPIFLGIAAADGFNSLLTRYPRRQFAFWHVVIIVAGITMAVEVMVLSRTILKSALVPVPNIIQEQKQTSFQNTCSLPEPYRLPATVYSVQETYQAMMLNLGWLPSRGASFLPPKTMCKGKDQPGYIAEFYQNKRPVEPVYWSPNKIVFEKLTPGVPLVVNMNPGSVWFNNGAPLFPSYKIVEQDKPFIVMPDAHGQVTLIYQNPEKKRGIIVTVVLAVFSGVIIFYRKKYLNKDFYFYAGL